MARVDRLHIFDLLRCHHAIDAVEEVDVVLSALDVFVGHLVTLLHHLSDECFVFERMDHFFAHCVDDLTRTPFSHGHRVVLDVTTTTLAAFTHNVVG